MKTGQQLRDIRSGSDFLGMTLKTQATKEKNRRIGFHEHFKIIFHENFKILFIKRFYQQNLKGSPQNERKYLQFMYLIRD